MTADKSIIVELTPERDAYEWTCGEEVLLRVTAQQMVESDVPHLLACIATARVQNRLRVRRFMERLEAAK